MDNLLQIANGEVVRRADIPTVSVETFGTTLADFVQDGGFVVQFFAFAEHGVTRLLAPLELSEPAAPETAEDAEIRPMTWPGVPKLRTARSATSRIARVT